MANCKKCHRKPQMLDSERCEDCWASAASHWDWRGQLPLELRTRRAQMKAEHPSDRDERDFH